MSIISPLSVLSQDEILDALNNIEKLPTLPIIVTKIIDTLSEPESTVNELSSIIKIDQSMSMQILRVANSAYYGFRSKVTILDRAIMVLGFEEIKRITMAAYIIKSIPFKLKDKKFSYNDFWLHSLGVAYCSRFIAEKIGEPKVDEVYTAGLLHDIGKIIIAQFFQKYFLIILHYAISLKKEFIDIEPQILGSEHTTLGKWLATIWDLPSVLRETIELHHVVVNQSNPIDSTNKLPYIVALANLLVKKNKIGISVSGNVRIPGELCNFLNLDESALAEITENLLEAKSAINSYIS